jgi:hypothetical protein
LTKMGVCATGSSELGLNGMRHCLYAHYRIGGGIREEENGREIPRSERSTTKRWHKPWSLISGKPRRDKQGRISVLGDPTQLAWYVWKARQYCRRRECEGALLPFTAGDESLYIPKLGCSPWRTLIEAHWHRMASADNKRHTKST